MSYHCETCRRFVPSGITHICVSASTPRTIPVAAATATRTVPISRDDLVAIADLSGVPLRKVELIVELTWVALREGR